MSVDRIQLQPASAIRRDEDFERGWILTGVTINLTAVNVIDTGQNHAVPPKLPAEVPAKMPAGL